MMPHPSLVFVVNTVEFVAAALDALLLMTCTAVVPFDAGADTACSGKVQGY